MRKTIQLFVTLLVIISFSVSCKNSNEKKIDLSNQANYEKFLSDMGITLPENATFKEIKKTNDGNYKIFYILNNFNIEQDSLQRFYEKHLDNLLLTQGWTKPENGWKPHGTMYEKDDLYFKFFLVYSKEYNIYELAFKYGQ